MYRGISVPARRRVLALLAALGAATVTSVVSAAAPAQADSADAIQAIPGTTHTVSITAHAARGGIIPFSSSLDITCNIQQLPPFPQGTTKATAMIVADATTLCTFDSTGLPASVDSIRMQQDLTGPDGFVHGTRDLYKFQSDYSSSRVTAPGCTHGKWTADLIVTVVFPPGYNPPSTAGGTGASLDFVNCPGDPPSGCTISCAGGGGGTAQAMGAENLLADLGGRKDRSAEPTGR